LLDGLQRRRHRGAAAADDGTVIGQVAQVMPGTDSVTVLVAAQAGALRAEGQREQCEISS
jgi:hypothetical protein